MDDRYQYGAILNKMFTLRSSVFGLASVAFIGRIVGKGSQFALSVLVARTLGADALGAFSFALVVLNLSASVTRLGLPKGIQHFVPKFESNHQRTQTTGTIVFSLVVVVLTSCVFFVGYHLVTSWTGFDVPQGYRDVTGLLLLGLPLYGIVRISEAVAKGFKNIEYSVYIYEFGFFLLSLLFAAIGINLLESVIGVAFGVLSAMAVAAILSLYLLYRLGAFAELRSMSVDSTELMAFSLPLLVSSIAHPIMMWSDILMLGFFQPPQTVGFYRAAYQVAVMLIFALASVNAIFPSFASELYHTSQHQRLGEVYTKITKWISLFTLFGVCYLVINADNVLRVFGEEFVTAQLTLIVLVSARGIEASVGPAGNMLSMTNNVRLEMINTIIFAILNVVLNYTLILRYGSLGAAVATGTSISLLNLVRIIEIKVILGFFPFQREYLRGLLPLIPAVGSLIAMDWLAPGEYLVQLLLSAVVSGVIVLLFAWRFTFSQSDRVLIEGIR